MKTLRIVRTKKVQHWLTVLRSKNTTIAEFRRVARMLGASLIEFVIETYDDIARVIATDVETPLIPHRGSRVVFPKPVNIISTLRSGNLLLDAVEGYLDETYLDNSVHVGFIGVERDEANPMTQVVEYCKVPVKIHGSICIVCEPMLATGGSAAAVARILLGAGAKKVVFLSLIVAPEGVAAIEGEFGSKVVIVACEQDAGLTDNQYITPGLGDAGDRGFGKWNHELWQSHHRDKRANRQRIIDLEQQMQNQFVVDAH